MSIACPKKTISSNETGLAYAFEECLGELPEVSPAIPASTVTTTLAILTNASGQGGAIAGNLWNFVSPTTTGSVMEISAPGMIQTLGGLSIASSVTFAIQTSVVTDITFTVNGPTGSTFFGQAMDGTDQDVVIPAGTFPAPAGPTSGPYDIQTSSGTISGTGSLVISKVSFDETVFTPAQASSEGPVWFPIDASNVGTIGSTTTYLTRETLSSGRQIQKGSPVDKESESNWTLEMTLTNQDRLLSTFFFADPYEKPGTDNIFNSFHRVTDITANTITIVGDDGTGLAISVGSLLKLSGFGLEGNNVMTKVTAVSGVVSPQVITVDAVLTAEVVDGDMHAVECGFEFDLDQLQLLNAGGSVSLSGVDAQFDNRGLVIGEWVHVGGGSDNSFTTGQGFARISSIADTILGLDLTIWGDPVSDAGTGKSIRIFWGRVYFDEKDTAKIKKNSIRIEQSLGEDEFGKQAQYIVGALGSTWSMKAAPGEYIETEMAFTALDSLSRTGQDGLWPGTRKNLPKTDALNATSHLVSMQMYTHADNTNPTSHFAYVLEAEINIDNNLNYLKALGVFGSFDVNVGDFLVGGQIEAYFENVLSIKAIETGADVGMYMAFAQDNAGILFDIPLLTLQGGAPTIEKDQAVLLPLESTAAENKRGYTMLATIWPYLPDSAMPVV